MSKYLNYAILHRPTNIIVGFHLFVAWQFAEEQHAEQLINVMPKSKRANPPDGGYGWVVVLSAFLVMGLTAAVLKNFGLFFRDIQTHFGVLTSTTSWVTSTTIAMFHLGGKALGLLHNIV